ncbi:hypothetical protein TNCV_3618151 [Trichonephila clavipes]|nr:hypothetical protein TNCV_3618151 [Trichonephila clavipes]
MELDHYRYGVFRVCTCVMRSNSTELHVFHGGFLTALSSFHNVLVWSTNISRLKIFKGCSDQISKSESQKMLEMLAPKSQLSSLQDLLNSMRARCWSYSDIKGREEIPRKRDLDGGG